jgi:dienelactone hydrolase
MRRCLVVLAVWIAGLVAPAAAAAGAFSSSYQGLNIWWNYPDSCNLAMPITGAEPDASGTYPVLVYLHGTYDEMGSLATSRAVLAEAAARGFVAVAPKYDSWATLSVDGVEQHARCVFREDRATSVVGAVCARVKADCSKGIVVAGHSQGGAIAGRAANWSRRIRAAWLLGVSGPNVPEARSAPSGTRTLANARIRIVDGQGDVFGPGTLTDLNAISGRSCAAGPSCLAADGSGWLLVQNAGVTDGVADHCYMTTNGCAMDPAVDARWRSGTAPWAMPAALAWLKRFVTA